MEEKRSYKFRLSLTGMGFITFIVFLILKVTGAWPTLTWFWVWFPLWISFVVSLLIWILVAILTIIISKL